LLLPFPIKLLLQNPGVSWPPVTPLAPLPPSPAAWLLAPPPPAFTAGFKSSKGKSNLPAALSRNPVL
jgi:hypothetical protein